MNYIIKNTLAACFHKLVESKVLIFSIVTDETTDVFTCKQFTAEVQCNLYDLIDLTSSNAETLFQAICSTFEKELCLKGQCIGIEAVQLPIISLAVK